MLASGLEAGLPEQLHGHAVLQGLGVEEAGVSDHLNAHLKAKGAERKREVLCQDDHLGTALLNVDQELRLPVECPDLLALLTVQHDLLACSQQQASQQVHRLVRPCLHWLAGRLAGQVVIEHLAGRAALWPVSLWSWLRAFGGRDHGSGGSGG